LTDDTAADPKIIWFAFRPTETQFTGVPALGSADFTIVATFEVQFDGTAALGTKKIVEMKQVIPAALGRKMLQDLEQQPVAAALPVGLSYNPASIADADAGAPSDVLVEDAPATDSTETITEDSNDWIVAVAVIVVLVVALAVCIFYGCLVHKRRRKRADNNGVYPVVHHDVLASGSGASTVYDVDF